jgi:endo-1,4-beta-xylanase
LAAALLWGSTADAAVGPIAACEKKKLTAASKGVKSALRCHGTAAGKGAAVDVACLDRAEEKLLASFAAADAAPPCPRAGEGTTVAAAIDALADALGASLRPPGISNCAKLELTAAGKYAQGILKAEAKHAATPERAKLAARLASAEVKLSSAFTRAELSGDCAAPGAADDVAAQVEQATNDIVNATRGTIKELASERGRLVGAAVQGEVLLSNPLYRATAARHFNYVSTWGETVWANVEPSQGVFNLAPLDAVVEFAEEHTLPVKGITLVWDQLLPGWLGPLPVDEFQAAVEHHIDTLVGGYAGRIHHWDVVNEAIIVGEPGNLRPSVFLQKLGPGYIAQMFHRAHQADPTALLYYNEFGAADLGPTSDAVYALVQDLLAQDVPIHGVGLQVHAVLGAGFSSKASLQANLQRFADLGLRVQLSEVDFRGGPKSEDHIAQRALYHDAIAACLAVPGCDVAIFGFTDNYIWIGPDPMPFDLDYLPKAAFFGIRDALVEP